MFEEVMKLDKQYYMNTFGERLPVCFVRGNGVKLYSSYDKTFYDFMGGIAVSSLGHNHPKLVKAICDQVKKVMHTSNLYYIESQAKLAKVLCDNSFAQKVFFSNSGAEANECAIKLARKYFYDKKQKRSEIITLTNSFHGRTMATISATGQEKYQKPYAPLLEKFIHVEKNNIKALTKAITKNTAAIILELIQGESGVLPLDIEYVKEVRELCDKNDIILIFDEVQTGMGRTGKLFAYENFMVEPDIMTLAKGLAGGVPIGATLCKDKFAAFVPGDHGSTFGGNHLATTAALVVAEELINNDLLKSAKLVGEYFIYKLENMRVKINYSVRGMGLMIGVEFKEPIAKDISKKMFEEGFLVGTIGEHIIRLVPPLIIKKEEVDLFMKSFEGLLK